MAGKQGKRPGWMTVAAVVATAAAVCLGLLHYATLARHIPLRALQDAPLDARVRLAGVVTYIDEPGKRFWIQDETGAMAIPVDPGPLALSIGQIVGISSVKTALITIPSWAHKVSILPRSGSAPAPIG